MSGDPPITTPEPATPKVRRRSDRGALYATVGAVVIVAILVGVGYGTHWYGLTSTSSSGGCPTGATLQGAGASFPSALVSQWVSGYTTDTGNLVNYASSGAGQGITDLTTKQVDFAVTDEGLNSTESSALVAAVGTVLTLPVTGGAVTLVYNIPGYPGPLNLTADQIVGIYSGSTGYTAWDSAAFTVNNPGLSTSTASVYAVHRSDQAGMSYVLTNYLSLDNTTWATSIGASIQPAWPAFAAGPGESGNSALIKEVAGQAGAIGYTDLYDAQSHKLPTAHIYNPHDEYIAPTVTSTASAVNDVYAADPSSFPASDGNWASISFVNAPGTTDYPLATVVYAMVPQNPGAGHTASAIDAEVLVQWLHWTLTTGESFNSTAFPYVNPPAALVTEALAALSNMTYNKGTIPTCS
jgi:phosphate transport system substrate-binding protein